MAEIISESQDMEDAVKNRAVKSDKIEALKMTEEYFGPLWPYVSDDNITDVDYNGEELWITDSSNRRRHVENSGVTPAFIEAFSQRVANQVSKPFNKMNTLLEAETPTLRISILHESAAVSGRSMCLRKTLPTVRMTDASIIRDGYLQREMLNLLVNCVRSKMNFVIGGEPGAGKTELAKFLSQYIVDDQRVITIEDSPEWHYREINPGHDCVEMRVNPDFDYAKAIKTCLRQNPKWIMLSEARSVEVKYLLESWSTGVNGITTLHTDDIRKIPSRILSMLGDRSDADRMEHDVYEFANVAVLVRRKQMRDGTAKRYVDQLGFLYAENGSDYKIHMLVKNGEVISHSLPGDIQFKLERAECAHPFDCALVDAKVGGEPYHFEEPVMPARKAVQDKANSAHEPAEEKPAVSHTEHAAVHAAKESGSRHVGSRPVRTGSGQGISEEPDYEQALRIASADQERAAAFAKQAVHRMPDKRSVPAKQPLMRKL